MKLIRERILTFLLIKSGGFRCWYKDFLSTLLFELERYDIDGKSTYNKYLKELKNLETKKKK